MNSFILKCPNCGKEMIISNDDIRDGGTCIEKNGIEIFVTDYATIYVKCKCGNKIE